MLLQKCKVVLTLEPPWRDGIAHLVISPPEFMQRLAALLPRPTLHQASLRPA